MHFSLKFVPKINRRCYKRSQGRPAAVRQQPGQRQSSLPGRSMAHGSWSLSVEGTAKERNARGGRTRTGLFCNLAALECTVRLIIAARASRRFGIDPRIAVSISPLMPILECVEVSLAVTGTCPQNFHHWHICMCSCTCMSLCTHWQTVSNSARHLFCTWHGTPQHATACHSMPF